MTAMRNPTMNVATRVFGTPSLQWQMAGHAATDGSSGGKSAIKVVCARACRLIQCWWEIHPAFLMRTPRSVRQMVGHAARPRGRRHAAVRPPAVTWGRWPGSPPAGMGALGTARTAMTGMCVRGMGAAPTACTKGHRAPSTRFAGTGSLNLERRASARPAAHGPLRDATLPPVATRG